MTEAEVLGEGFRRMKAAGLAANDLAADLAGLASEYYGIGAWCIEAAQQADLSHGALESLVTAATCARAIAEALRAPTDTLCDCLRKYGIWPRMSIAGFPPAAPGQQGAPPA